MILTMHKAERLDVSLIEEEPLRWEQDWDDDDVDERFAAVLKYVTAVCV